MVWWRNGEEEVDHGVAMHSAQLAARVFTALRSRKGKRRKLLEGKEDSLAHGLRNYTHCFLLTTPSDRSRTAA